MIEATSTPVVFFFNATKQGSMFPHLTVLIRRQADLEGDPGILEAHVVQPAGPRSSRTYVGVNLLDDIRFQQIEAAQAELCFRLHGVARQLDWIVDG